MEQLKVHKAILRYLIDNDHYGTVGGNIVWKKMQMFKVHPAYIWLPCHCLEEDAAVQGTPSLYLTPVPVMFSSSSHPLIFFNYFYLVFYYLTMHFNKYFLLFYAMSIDSRN